MSQLSAWHQHKDPYYSQPTIRLLHLPNTTQLLLAIMRSPFQPLVMPICACPLALATVRTRQRGSQSVLEAHSFSVVHDSRTVYLYFSCRCCKRFSFACRNTFAFSPRCIILSACETGDTSCVFCLSASRTVYCFLQLSVACAYRLLIYLHFH